MEPIQSLHTIDYKSKGFITDSHFDYMLIYRNKLLFSKVFGEIIMTLKTFLLHH